MLSHKQLLQIDFENLNNLANIAIEETVLLTEALNVIKTFQGKVEKYNKLLALKLAPEEMEKQILFLIAEMADDKSPFLALKKKNYDPLAATALTSAHQSIKTAFINYKEENFKVVLPSRPESLSLKYQQSLLEKDEKTKNAFYLALSKIEKMNKFKCHSIYISHAEVSDYAEAYNSNSESKWILPFLKILSSHLTAAGMHVKLLSDDLRAGENIFSFMQALPLSKYVLHIGTLSLLKRHSSAADTVVHSELNYIRRKSNKGIIPLLVEGTPELSYPIEFINYSTMKNWGQSKTYFSNFCELIQQLYDINDQSLKPIWDEFLNSIDKTVRSKIDANYVDEKSVSVDVKLGHNSITPQVACQIIDIPYLPIQSLITPAMGFSTQVFAAPPPFQDVIDQPPAYDHKESPCVDIVQQAVTKQSILNLSALPIASIIATPSIATSPHGLYSPQQLQSSAIDMNSIDSKSAQINSSIPDSLQEILNQLNAGKIEEKKIIIETINSMKECILVRNQIILLIDAYNKIRPYEEKSKGLFTLISNTQYAYKLIGDWFKKNKATLENAGIVINKQDKKISFTTKLLIESNNSKNKLNSNPI